MARILVQSTIRIDIEITDFNGAYIDPSMQTLEIYDPNGNKKETYSQGDPDYIRDGAGKYHCNYSSPSDAARGLWRIDWKATVGGLSEHRESNFVVV